jgi:hypothetical protein
VSSVRPRRQQKQRLVTRLLLLVRVLTTILCLQLSGAGDGLADLVRSVTCEDVRHQDECPLQGPCQDCPPGCPNCHCANALTSLVPHVGPPTLLGLTASLAPPGAAPSHAPLGPERVSLFRPPRIDAVTS